MLAVDPTGLILLASIDAERPYAAAGRIAALEWCAGNGAAIVISCQTKPPPTPPFDRILYGALEIARVNSPVTSRLIVPASKAHHKSNTQERVRLAVLKDPELGPLFEFNKSAPTNVLGQPPCVDLLWCDGRVVVELDGHEHFIDPKYGQDRHRDYELLVAGYLVLRITNAQAATDLQFAIEKIRKVVRYRQSQGGFRSDRRVDAKSVATCLVLAGQSRRGKAKGRRTRREKDGPRDIGAGKTSRRNEAGQ